MTFANKIHSRLCAWQEWRDWSPDGRRRGAGPLRRSAETVERPPLPAQKQGNSCCGTGKFLRENTEVFRNWHVSYDLSSSVTGQPSEPTPPWNAPTPSATPANEHLKFIPPGFAAMGLV